MKWISSGNQLDYELLWHHNEPDEKESRNEKEKCGAIENRNQEYKFSDHKYSL